MLVKERASYLRNRDLIWTHYWSVWEVGLAAHCHYGRQIQARLVVVVASSTEGKYCCPNLYYSRCPHYYRAGPVDYLYSYRCFHRPFSPASPDFRIASSG